MSISEAAFVLVHGGWRDPDAGSERTVPHRLDSSHSPFLSRILIDIRGQAQAGRWRSMEGLAG